MVPYESRDSSCPHCDEVGAYALHALDDHEAAVYEQHLRTCAECTADLSQLQLVVDTLPMTAAQLAPSPALKSRIMSVVNAESELLRAAGADLSPVPARASRWRLRLPATGWSLRPALAGALACGVLAVGVLGGVVASGGLGGSDDRSVAAKVTGAASAKVDLSGDRAALELVNLPTLSDGSVYQVWVDRGDGVAHPTHTLFNVRSDGRAKVAIDESVKGVKKILVTRERSGGALKPSGTPVVTAALS